MSVLKMHCRKLPRKVKSYRGFPNYDNRNFTKSLNGLLNKYENQELLSYDLDCFYKVCTELLN